MNTVYKLWPLQYSVSDFFDIIVAIDMNNTFCPTSAALFFGSLLPMSIEQESAFLLPLIFGASTSLPVVIFALLISLGVKKVGTLFNRLSSFERYCRILTGIVFLIIGILM